MFVHINGTVHHLNQSCPATSIPSSRGHLLFYCSDSEHICHTAERERERIRRVNSIGERAWSVKKWYFTIEAGFFDLRCFGNFSHLIRGSTSNSAPVASPGSGRRDEAAEHGSPEANLQIV
jgi:hypothetical protein